MSMSVVSEQERRQFPRIRFKAYGYKYHVELIFTGKSHDVSLVDISPAGARLGRLVGRAFCPAKEGEELTMKFLMDTKGIIPDKIICVVRWREGDELGVQFTQQLDVSVGELQKLLGP